MMQTYEHYKDSGIDWIGPIPEHWNKMSLKHFSSLKARIGFHGLNSNDFIDNGDAYCITGTDIKYGEVDFSSSYKVSEYWYNLDKNIQIKNGDVLITKDGTIGKVGIVNNLGKTIKATLNSGVFVLRTSECSKYLFWNIISNVFKTQVDLISRGSTINHLYERDFKNFNFVLPPIQEQEAIANFLDEKTAKIDALVQTKEQQIEKLKELRQAKIHQAVTKGLDASAPTKDSGVEWIGEIPKHWEVSSLKWYAKIYSGGTPDKSNLKYWENGTIPWLGSGEVNQEIVNTPTSYITEEGLYKSSAKWMMKDSLILALAGQGKTKGMVAYMNFNATGNQSLASINPNPKLYSKYLFFYLKASYRILRGEAGEGQRDGLNLQILGAHTVLIPPIQEQEQIVAYLDEVTGKIDQAIFQKQEQITKLKEYKQSLINDVVTGKVRVC